MDSFFENSARSPFSALPAAVPPRDEDPPGGPDPFGGQDPFGGPDPLSLAPFSLQPTPPPVTDTADLIDGLNEPQREAVSYEGGPLLIVAGAGSGKTRVLTHRIAYLLRTGRARPRQILAITFTNKAAAEMRDRVAELVGGVSRTMWVSTFHSACVRILRQQATTLGLKSTFSIYDAADSQRLMTLVARELEIDLKKLPSRRLLNRISNLKDELVDPDDFAAAIRDQSGPQAEQNQLVASAYRRYQERLQAANALDFDDLIMSTVGLLQAFPDVADHYRRQFRHVLVDEYQDTNHAQYVLIQELVSPTNDGHVPAGELTVVGDADQSIYAFRGASIRNITEFESDFPHARTILLEQNYRSTQNILTAANSVISRNPARKAKKLWTAAGTGEPIVGYVADTEHDEARFIAAEIDRLSDEAGVRPGDVAVFYRTNAQSRALEEVLIRVGLPYRVVGGTRFYERREIKDAIAYLRAIVNPDDDVNVRRIVNTPKRGIGDRSEAMVAAHAERRGISFSAALTEVDDILGLAPRGAKLLGEFRDFMAELRALDQGPAGILDAVLDRTGYLEQLRASDDPQDASRIENLAELHAVAAEFEAADPEGDLADFLERVSLVADSDQIPTDEDDDGVVTLMTLHTAKGLEFPVVFLTGLEDGTLPHLRSLADSGELAEERRLAYVGLTRAQERLYLTRAAVRTSWGTPNEFPASRFLEDLPEEVMDWRRRESSTQALRPSWGSGRWSDEQESGERRTPRSSIRTTPSTGSSGATFGSATPRRDSDIPVLAVGDQVSHDAYGLGRVIEMEGTGRNAVAKVDFGSAGTKRLLLRYAPVTKL
jgi:DNA helicase-2/ATP-dependent DNA helicase PcrA